MQNNLVEDFKDWAKKKEWVVECGSEPMELPDEVITRYKNIPEQWFEFIVHFDDVVNNTDDMWFLTCKNYVDDCWSYNDFENISLEAESFSEFIQKLVTDEIEMSPESI